MSRPRNSTEAKLAITGRDVSEADNAVKYGAAGGGWVLLGPPSEYDLTDERRWVHRAASQPRIGYAEAES